MTTAFLITKGDGNNSIQLFSNSVYSKLVHFRDTCPSSYATVEVADPGVASIIANITGCIHKEFIINV